MLAEWPKAGKDDEGLLSAFSITKKVVTNVRKIRKEKNIQNKEKLSLIVKENKTLDRIFDPAIVQLCNLDQLEYKNEKPDNAFGFVVQSNEYFVPFSENVDVDLEMEKIQKELDYIKGFLIGVDKKLSNQRFVDNAPPKVVEIELRKKADAEHKMDILEAKLKAFKSN
jgi:valyl-tRNA synthetase